MHLALPVTGVSLLLFWTCVLRHAVVGYRIHRTLYPVTVDPIAPAVVEQIAVPSPVVTAKRDISEYLARPHRFSVEDSARNHTPSCITALNSQGRQAEHGVVHLI